MSAMTNPRRVFLLISNLGILMNLLEVSDTLDERAKFDCYVNLCALMAGIVRTASSKQENAYSQRCPRMASGLTGKDNSGKHFL